MKTVNKLLLLVTLLLLPIIAVATSPTPPPIGPQVPCLNCDSLTVAPFPETGLWSNPEQSPGSGLNFEIQNGVLAGYLYTYSDTGQPEWFIISGPLVRSENAGVMWELDTHLTRVEGGTCFGCDFTPPDQITSGDQVRLEFMQRNHLMISVLPDAEGGPVPVAHREYFVPFIYGSVGKAYFEAQTAYLLPEFGPDKLDSQFVLSYRPVSVAESPHWVSLHVYIKAVETTGTQDSRELTYTMRLLDPNRLSNPNPEPIMGQIICELDISSQQPGCRIESDGITYKMPIGNFSDSRFLAEAADGSVIEGFRIGYD